MSLNLGPASARFHHESPSSTHHRRPLRKSKSHVAFLAPLANLVRNPLETLATAVNSYNHPAVDEAEAAAVQAAAHRQALYLRLQDAETYADWKAAVTELDVLEGNEAWKEEDVSDEYDYALVAAKLQELDDARLSCDPERMLFLLRTSLTRGLGHMGRLRLYKHSHIGTKKLIERYIDSACQTLTALLDVSEKMGVECPISPHDMVQQLQETRASFGRTALLLSGGGTFGMNHIGVIRALWESGMLPHIVSGASAGSIVGAVLCVKLDEEIPHVLDNFCYGNLDVFGEANGLMDQVLRVRNDGALFEIDHLKVVMQEHLGDMTFQEAYNRTGRILNIPVSSSSLYELPRLLNYITAPHVMIWSAVCASCSVPGVYTESSLAAKDPKTGKTVSWDLIDGITWIDGSVDSDLPMTRLAEMFNVNHFIVSQVNPHVVPFLAKEEEMVADQVHGNNVHAAGSAFLRNAAVGAKEEIVYRLQQTADAGIMPIWVTKLRSILNQQYSGDINIFPKIAYADFPRVLSNPTQDYMLGCMLTGQRATWPKLSRVHNHVVIELALESAIHEAKIRSTFQDAQPISRPKSAGELCAQNRSKSHLKLSLSAYKTAPTSPVLRKSAPTSPRLSRKRNLHHSSSSRESNTTRPRRSYFSQMLALNTKQQARENHEEEAFQNDDDDDYWAASETEHEPGSDLHPDLNFPPLDPFTTTTTTPSRLGILTTRPRPASLDLPPSFSFSSSPPHPHPTTIHTTPPKPTPASTPERRAFFLANLAMTPASNGSTALPVPVVAAMPSSPGVRPDDWARALPSEQDEAWEWDAGDSDRTLAGSGVGSGGRGEEEERGKGGSSRGLGLGLRFGE